MLQLPVYLDNNATTPCDPRVVEAMLPYFNRFFGNAASRNHSYGWQAKEAVDIAREQVAALIGAEPQEIVFTSGATESDNLAIKGVFEAYRSKGNHIITLATEHKAVLDTCHHLARQGAEITLLPVANDGSLDCDHLEAAIRNQTILIAVMYANNETGVIQPIKTISEIARRHGIPFFSDAVQAAGKIPVDVNKDGIDLLSLSAHKIYGPKGCGALYIRRKNPRIRLTAQIDGGGHERGMRSGTLAVPNIVGLGKAAELVAQEMQDEASRLRTLRDRLEAALTSLPGVVINGSLQNRMPHVSNLSFEHTESESLIISMHQHLAVSSGSACSSASIEPSYVLKAMGLSDEMAHAAIRFSLGRFTDSEQIEYAIKHAKEAVGEARKNRFQQAS